MTTLYLIRHGEIQSVFPRRFVGSQELPLNETGRRQMTDMAEFLALRPIDRLICSPLSRCRESAMIIGNRLGKVPDVYHQLAEICLGTWEGLTAVEVEKRYPGQYAARGNDIAQFRPENGESFQDLLDRTWPVFEKLAGMAGEQIAIVTHAGVNRVLLCRILGMPLANLFRLSQDYGCANLLHRNSHGLQVCCLNFQPRSGP